MMWDFKIFLRSRASGVLATGGDVLVGAIRDGNLVALDARSGKHLWHFQTGANISASPMSYAVGGRQLVAISAGNTVYAFGACRIELRVAIRPITLVRSRE